MRGTIQLKDEQSILCETFDLDKKSLCDLNGYRFLLRKPDLDWKNLCRLLERHRLGSLFYWHLKRFELLDELPSDFVSELKKRDKSERLRQLGLVSQLLEISKVFKSEEICFLSLKGPALGQLLYGDPTLRHSKDLDILVRPEQLFHSIQVLQRLGFKDQDCLFGRLSDPKDSSWRHLYHLHLRKGPIEVELHWRISRNEGLVALTLDDCFSSQQHVSVGGLLLPTLGNAHLLKYLSLHGASHCWNRLKWLVDIKFILRKGLHPIPGDRAVALAKSLHDRIWPGKEAGLKANDRLTKCCVKQIFSDIEAPDSFINMQRRSLLLFQLHSGLVPRLLYLRRLLIWPPVYELIDLPRRLEFLYPFVGLIFWMLSKAKSIGTK